MDYFRYKNNNLFCEDFPLSKMSKIKTPFYIYSWRTFEEHFLNFKKAFKEIDPLVCFSVKTCNNISILKRLAALGAGMDIVSGGELFLCEKANVPMEKIVFAGVGKTFEEISYAVDNKIGFFNIESEPEFIRIENILKSKKKEMSALLRVNPDEYDTKTHDKTTTGKKDGKFGIDYMDALSFFEKYKESKYLKLEGIHIHIGSPIYSPVPYVKAIEKVIYLIEQLREKGIMIKYINLGGGYSANYCYEESIPWENYSEAITPLLRPLKNRGVNIIMEPGRTISANSGILVTTIQYIKKTENKNIVITDTGMHHLIRPALYDANHFIWPIKTNNPLTKRILDVNIDGLIEYDIVGPICESSDYLAKGRKLPLVKEADRLAIFSTGAYGNVMSSNYNAQLKPAEYLVINGEVLIIKEAEEYEDLLYLSKNERILDVK